MTESEQHVELNERYGAHNYRPLPVVLTKGQGEWVWDVEGRRYLDLLSAYSALNHGHCHPRLIEVLGEQAAKLTLTSRAFHNDQLGPWLKELTTLCGLPRALPMNTGAEAVETALKLARKWGYQVKGVPPEQAEIIVCEDNFHGRTITVVSFSTVPEYRSGFGPFTPGFKVVPYGDAAALEQAITSKTVGFLVEPIQGEAGVRVPPAGYLARAAALCRERNVLLMLDEVQTGLGRTGKMFCFQYDDCRPDLLVLGKALGGGMVPISAVVGRDEVMSVLRPGEHGSTFGGNPLACAVSREAMELLREEKLVERAETLGKAMREGLSELPRHIVTQVRGMGLLNAVEIAPAAGSGRFYSELLARKGVLARETHDQVLRLAPPLVAAEASLDFAMVTLQEVLSKTEAEWGPLP